MESVTVKLPSNFESLVEKIREEVVGDRYGTVLGDCSRMSKDLVDRIIDQINENIVR